MNHPPQAAWQDVSVVIVAFNSERVIARSVASVKAAARVILVDNASSDKTVEIAQDVLPSIRIIRNPFNMGYGAANNLGFETVTTPYGMILNPDAVVGAVGMDKVLRHLEHDRQCGVCAPLLESPEGRPELYVMGFHERRHHGLASPPDGPFCTGFIMGAAMVWRMDAWREIGGFDEAIFLYGEDTDLSLRTTKARYSMIVEPRAVVKHLGGQSEPPSRARQWRRNWHMTWGGLYVQSKWEGPAPAQKRAWGTVWKNGLKTLFYIFVLRINRACVNFARANAAWTFLRGRPSWRGRNT